MKVRRHWFAWRTPMRVTFHVNDKQFDVPWRRVCGLEFVGPWGAWFLGVILSGDRAVSRRWRMCDE